MAGHMDKFTLHGFTAYKIKRGNGRALWSIYDRTDTLRTVMTTKKDAQWWIRHFKDTADGR